MSASRFFAVVLIVCATPALAHADPPVIDIFRAEKIVYPIALPAFQVEGGADAGLANDLPDMIGHDLEFTGLFKVLDRTAYLEKPGSAKLNGEGTHWEDWTPLKATALVRGGVKKVDGGRISAIVFVFDVNGKLLLGSKQFNEAAGQLPKLTGELADAVYKLTTGDDSFFSSKLAWVNNRTGSKELYQANFDGKGEQAITKNHSINLSPSWSPDGKKIVFTSYVRAHPDLYLYDRIVDKFFKVSSRDGVNIGGVWAPQGRVMAATLSADGGSPSIFLMQEDGRGLKRLTNTYNNDVSPTWSPDAQHLAFVSDRGGSPNIYVMTVSGANPVRITFDANGAGKDNENPSWSPRGDRIAFQSRLGGVWQILTCKPDGSDTHAITSAGANEDPSWSPDGRMLAYIHDGKVSVMEADGSNARVVAGGAGSYSNVSWSTRIPW